ncbi:MAG: hypothetical protein M0C28_04820 [Candidatus Moduliflexus flocculans]|nr:hypothetical protein [Candidatus Moduliflexus flocculans]
MPSAMTTWPDSLEPRANSSRPGGQAVDRADGQGLDLALQLEQGDVVGLVDPEQALDLDLLALDVQALDVGGLGDDVIGRDDDVLGQGQGRSLEDLGLVGAVADDRDDARAGLAEEAVGLLRLGRGPGRRSG